MRLTTEQLESLEKSRGDWEAYHSIRDDIVLGRLKELDPEFSDQLEEVTKDGTFWCA